MSNLQQRLDRLLSDKRVKSAAAQAGQRWIASEDDEQFDRDLTFIEGELAVLEAEDLEKQEELARVEAWRAAEERYTTQKLAELRNAGVPEEVLETLDIADADETLRNVKELRAGAPGLPMGWRGEWDRNIEYKPGDTVGYTASSFVARKSSIGRAPPGDVWDLLAVRVMGGGGGGSVVSGGFQNLFVQQSNPGLTIPGLWVETRGDGTVKTVWAETA